MQYHFNQILDLLEEHFMIGINILRVGFCVGACVGSFVGHVVGFFDGF